MPSLQANLARFEALHAQVLGISVDSLWSHKAWAKEIGVAFPLLSDYHPFGQVTSAYGITRADGSAERAIFIIDKAGTIRYIDVVPVLQQPILEEVFATLESLK